MIRLKGVLVFLVAVALSRPAKAELDLTLHVNAGYGLSLKSRQIGLIENATLGVGVRLNAFAFGAQLRMAPQSHRFDGVDTEPVTASLLTYFRYSFDHLSEVSPFVSSAIGLAPIMVLRGDVGHGSLYPAMSVDCGVQMKLAGNLRWTASAGVWALTMLPDTDAFLVIPGVSLGLVY